MPASYLRKCVGGTRDVSNVLLTLIWGALYRMSYGSKFELEFIVPTVCLEDCF